VGVFEVLSFVVRIYFLGWGVAGSELDFGVRILI
jgi:hypothetical protein